MRIQGGLLAVAVLADESSARWQSPSAHSAPIGIDTARHLIVIGKVSPTGELNLIEKVRDGSRKLPSHPALAVFALRQFQISNLRFHNLAPRPIVLN